MDAATNEIGKKLVDEPRLDPPRWSYAAKAILGVIVALAIPAAFGMAIFNDLRHGLDQTSSTQSGTAQAQTRSHKDGRHGS